IANITTASNLFHCLRRQLTWPFRKPLVIFSPKANLRHPGSHSHMNEFINAGFKEVLDDDSIKDDSKVKKVLFCNGKLFFDLAAHRNNEKNTDISIIRIEQLYHLQL